MDPALKPLIKEFCLAFIPLFVALDGVGLLPLFWGLVQPLDAAAKSRAAREAVLTALIASLGFLLISRFVFTLMGLTLADVMVAGGLILIVVCLRDLIWSESLKDNNYPNPGVVPVGVPLLAGPALLTTVLLVRDRYGWQMTLIALFVNMLIIWLILRASAWLMRIIGKEGADVVSKIASLTLTAFGVMLIRHAILLMIKPPAP